VSEGGTSLDRGTCRRPPLALFRAAARGLADGKIALREACAVFGETEAVAGPEEKIERDGGSKVVSDEST
jgi:hypothetical protein